MRWDSDRPGLQANIEEWRQRGLSIGFVATMGGLHRGHLSLVEASAHHCDRTIVSVFVNPAQFGPNEDFAAYPRNEDRDTELSVAAGADLVWVPDVTDIYASNEQTRVVPGALANRLCGVSRPQFFGGICTVVLKLFQIIRPDVSFFGEKDYQQLLIIRKMVHDFFLPVEIIGCPIVRASDGLAMSSRNQRIPAGKRKLALHLHRCIETAQHLFAEGTRDPAEMAKQLKNDWPEGLELDYLEFRDPVDLVLVGELEPGTRLFLGAWLVEGDGQGVRLIDNAALA